MATTKKQPTDVQVLVDGPIKMPTVSLGNTPAPSVPDINDYAQADESTIPSIVKGALGDAKADTPSLAPQGPKNPIAKFFSRITGQSADTPEPGKLYEGPTTSAEKRANLGSYLKNLSSSLSEAAAPFGTPEQKTYAMELPERERELDATMALKNATLNATNAYHQGQIANASEKNDIARQKDIGAMRVKGYMPDEGGAGYRPMSEDEILSDPILSRNRDIAAAAMNSKNAQAQLAQARSDALTNPNSLTQQNKLKELEIKARQADGYLAMARQRLQLSQARTSLAGYNSMMNTGMNGLTGEFLGDAQARGAAPQTFADVNGAPVPYRMQSAYMPTSSMRTQQQMAQTIEPMVPKIQNEVKGLAQKIGPVAGAWNNFWVNKQGLNDPDFAALDTDLSLYATALGKAHFGAKIPEGFVDDMMRQFGEAQSPENLLERLEHANDWIAGYASFHANKTAPHGSGGGGNVPSFAEWKKGQGGANAHRP